MAQQTEPSTKPSAESGKIDWDKAPRIKLHEIPEGSRLLEIRIGDEVTWRPGENLSDEERRKRVKDALRKAGL